MPDREKAIKGLQIERECVSRDCDRDCGKCDLVQDRDWLLSVYDDALALLKEQPQWISVKDRMPAETHSMFFKLYGTPKWRNAMWREESDHVLVAIAFEDGSQFVTSGYTQDGKWHTGISKMLPYTVTHWMQMPEPPEEVKEDG